MNAELTTAPVANLCRAGAENTCVSPICLSDLRGAATSVAPSARGGWAREDKTFPAATAAGPGRRAPGASDLFTVARAASSGSVNRTDDGLHVSRARSGVGWSWCASTDGAYS